MEANAFSIDLHVIFLSAVQLFARSDSAGGTYVSTSAAVYTSVRVDRILFAFRDSASGTFIDASAACNAIVANYISHNL